MALIKCAECGKEFSDRADACPNCGCPIEYQAEKSIGGEYHAADKLAPSVIIEHLTIAKELESERYIISKLDVAINCLYQIKDNQYMLYETLEDCLDTSDRIASQVSTLTDSNKNIEACSAVAAYNSKIAASNSDALVFIEAYKGANGL